MYTYIFTYTVNRGYFEWRGNFEHCSIFPFNDLYNQNGRVYQKLYFLLVVPFILTISNEVEPSHFLFLSQFH